MAQGQYIRIYHSLKDEYPKVWRSDAQLGLFIRLLLIADKWYPQLAPIGRRNGAYQSLLKAGLVIENREADGYTIKGLERGREARSEHGKHAASMRWSNAQTMPSRAEQSKAKQSNGQSPTFMGWKPNFQEIERQHEDARRLAAEALEKRTVKE